MKLPPLIVKKVINATAEQVFAAWSKPELMQQWFFPEATWRAITKIDFRIGGHYQHEMISEEGKKYLHEGEYREIIPLKRIVFTWNSDAVTNTLVTVELNALSENKTEIILTHEMFTDEEERCNHQEGWNLCLDNVNNTLQTTLRNISGDTHEDFQCHVTINATPHQVYAAITEQEGLSNWWTPTCTATPKVDSHSRFDFGENYTIMKVQNLLPNQEVIWHCEKHHHMSPELKRSDEWEGTHLIFQLKENNQGNTDLVFTHRGLNKNLSCYDICFERWTHFLKTSLKGYLETGKGQPYQE